MIRASFVSLLALAAAGNALPNIIETNTFVYSTVPETTPTTSAGYSTVPETTPAYSTVPVTTPA
ncbi:hypothetical protein LPJ60_005497, partial [Coemansia sp. RSA 2675]